MVVGALLYLAGMRGVLLAGMAIIIAALISYIFFPTQRDIAAKRLEEFRHKEEKPRTPDEDMAIEDAAIEDAAIEDAAEEAQSAEFGEEPGEEQGHADPELD